MAGDLLVPAIPRLGADPKGFTLLHAPGRRPPLPFRRMTAPKLDKEKARKAAAHPARPGEECRAPAGSYQPVVDRSKCEGKNDCVEVCPYQVFEVRRMDDADF